MNKFGKIAIVVVLIAAVVVAIAVRRNKSVGQQVSSKYKPEQLEAKALPTLIDLGAGTCIPCKMMAPILEELKKELAGKLVVEFLDIGKNPLFAQEYQIRVMPTQIFYDASGKELFRHEGFYSKEDILAKWAEIGFEFTKIK
jgi:thioredoxin 1